MLDEIRIKRNGFVRIIKRDYRRLIVHEIGHAARINYSDRNILIYLHGLNLTGENFVTKYARKSRSENEKEDFAESISFWRGNTKLYWMISQRNRVMQEKYAIVSRQLCFGESANMTLCPLYLSQNATMDPPQYYNGTIGNYTGLFEDDLKRRDVRIMKNVRDLEFEDFYFMEATFPESGT